MDSRLTRWCDGFLEAGWLVAILATPLFFNIHSERVFEPDKIVLLRSLTLLMAAAWAVRFVDQRGWRRFDRLRFANPEAIWHKPLVLPVLALIIVYLLATLFSVTPRVSWAGSYQRLQGTYTTLSYIVIFALMANGLRSAEQVRRVVTVAIVTSIPVSLYGLLQHFGHDPLPWGGDVQTRVAGHMGNAIFIAAYLIMVIPLTVARIVDAFSNILGDERLAGADILRSSVYIFILAIQLLTLYWSGSRGPLIGLSVGLFSFTLVLLVSLRDTAETEKRRIRDIFPALLLVLPAGFALLISKPVSNAANPLIAIVFFFSVVAISIGAIFVLLALRRGWAWLWLSWILLTVLLASWLLLFNIPADRTAAWRNVPVAGGVFEILDEWRDLPVIGSYGRMLDPSNTAGREKSGRVRVLIWQGVINLITPHTPIEYPDGRDDPFNWLRPILGYGPESMYVVYNKFYPPELATVEARNASPDRSHNETFDALAITGAAGLIAWQVLYLSVILFAFRYLHVVQSRRDAVVLIALWAGGAIAAAALAVMLAGPIYLGVAVPTGVIVGVIIYLIYYALSGSRDIPAGQPAYSSAAPFATDRLLMNALVAAVLAHYVEIHFGIAISVTRLYFFAFIAVMIALGYQRQLSKKVKEDTEKPAVVPNRDGRRKRRTVPTLTEPAPRAGWSALLVPAILLVLMLGLLGYGFITYALPPDKTITSPADLTAAEIFRQSLMQNARRDFVDWPFVLSMFVLSWMLGWLVFIGEMVKYGELRLPLPTKKMPVGSRYTAAAVFGIMALLSLAARFLVPVTTATSALGLSLALIAALALTIVAIMLFLDRPAAQSWATLVAVGLLIMGIPVLLTGALFPAFLLVVTGAVVLYLTARDRWQPSILPPIAIIFSSLLIGFLIIYLHAINYHRILFYRGSPDVGSATAVRAFEAVQAAGLLTNFFVFLSVILIGLAFALSWPSITGGRRQFTNGSPAIAYGSLALAFLFAFVLLFQTNIRYVQADMIYKRAKPYDDQATRSTQADTSIRLDLWDTAIAIYDMTIDRVPSEDFYYLFQGRAYLERAGLTEDITEKIRFLTAAERLLLNAQHLNPLNTDHTANLARLNTRWYAAVESETDKAERLALADQYYQAALALSPQNSIIRNEYGRLVLELQGDCDRALAIYDDLVAIDPYYAQNYLSRADAYISCAGGRDEADREQMFRTAAASLERALESNPANIRSLVQLAEIYRQLGEYEQAFSAIEGARAQNDPVIFPPAEIDFLAAQVAAGLGNIAEARALALQALETAGEQTTPLIEAFLEDLDGG